MESSIYRYKPQYAVYLYGVWLSIIPLVTNFLSYLLTRLDGTGEWEPAVSVYLTTILALSVWIFVKYKKLYFAFVLSLCLGLKLGVGFYLSARDAEFKTLWVRYLSEDEAKYSSLFFLLDGITLLSALFFSYLFYLIYVLPLHSILKRLLRLS